jgi:hypothetical protein
MGSQGQALSAPLLERCICLDLHPEGVRRNGIAFSFWRKFSLRPFRAHARFFQLDPGAALRLPLLSVDCSVSADRGIRCRSI